MGKPISMTGKFPFTIGGIKVTGAKHNGETFVDKLYILKQRSAYLYDLIDDKGTVYEYMQMVYRNKNTDILDFDEDDDKLSESLKDGTFYIKEEDTVSGVKGFSTMYMINKIKLHNGRFIERKKE